MSVGGKGVGVVEGNRGEGWQTDGVDVRKGPQGREIKVRGHATFTQA